MLFPRIGRAGQLRRCRWPWGADGPESLLARSSASAPGDDGSEAFERVARTNRWPSTCTARPWPCAWGPPTAQHCIS